MGIQSAQQEAGDAVVGIKHTASDMKILEMASLMAILQNVTGDKDAVACAQSLINISSVWDSFVDGDSADIEPENMPGMIDKAFMDATFLMDTNPFWASFKPFLMPVWITAVNAYMDSRIFEEQLDDDVAMEMAFTSRLVVYEIFPAIAFCSKGFDAMRTVSLAIRRSAHYLSLEDWKAKMRTAK